LIKEAPHSVIRQQAKDQTASAAQADESARVLVPRPGFALFGEFCHSSRAICFAMKIFSAALRFPRINSVTSLNVPVMTFRSSEYEIGFTSWDSRNSTNSRNRNSISLHLDWS